MKRNFFQLALPFVFLFGCQSVFGQNVFYSTVSHLFKLDLNTCSATNLGSFSSTIVSGTGNGVFDIAFHPNGNLYVTNGEDLYIVDTTSLNSTYVGFLVSPFSSNFINALVADNNGNMYAADPVGRFYSVNINTGLATQIGMMPIGSAGDLAFYNGKLYLAAIGGDIYEVNINNPSQSVLVGSTNSPEDFYGIITVATSCQNAVAYGGQNSLYQVDLTTLNTTLACALLPGPITGMSMPSDFIISDCNIYVDLDANNSSGASAGDFQNAVCDTISPISDTDVSINSDAPLDSMWIWIDSGILNTGDEILTCSPTANISIVQNNTASIKFLAQSNATISHFENAIKNTIYQNQATNPQNGLRTILVKAFANGDSSDVVQAALSMNFTYSSDTTLLATTTCDPSQVNSQTQTFTNQYGCDSVVITGTVLLPSDTTYFTSTTCDPSQAGQQVQTFTNQYGCDSLIILNNILLPTDTTSFYETTCDSTVAGTFITPFTNQYGCDSLIIQNVQWIPADTTLFTFYTCDVSQTDTNVQVFTNQYSCDSFVITRTIFIPADTTILTNYVCDSLAAGTEVVFLTNQYGCDSTVISQSVYVENDVAYSLNVENVKCAGEATGSATVDLAVDTSLYRIVWSNGDTTWRVESISKGWYYFTIFDVYNCSKSDSVFVDETTPLSLEIAKEGISCHDERDGFMSMAANGGVAPYRYRWHENMPFSDTRQYFGFAAGTYGVQVQDALGCIFTQPVTFQNPPLFEVKLGEDIVIDSHADTMLTVQIINGVPPFDYIWTPLIENASCYDCPNLLIQNLYESQYFVVEVTDSNNCMAKDLIWVNVNKNVVVKVPTGFTPNNDNVNDYLFIQANDWVVRVVKFSVYDRWGELVFQRSDFLPNDENLGWDGVFKGKTMQTGTFGWVAEVELKDGKVKSFLGNTTLVR